MASILGPGCLTEFALPLQDPPIQEGLTQGNGKPLQTQLLNNVVSVRSASGSFSLVNPHDVSLKPSIAAAGAATAFSTPHAAVAPTSQQQGLVCVKVPTSRLAQSDLLLSHSYPRVAVAATQVGHLT
jgi:hypothetical protein